jgi:hypothetical protein
MARGYVLDDTFTEDASRIRRGTVPEISASIRRMALKRLQRDKTVKDTFRGKRLRAGWNGIRASSLEFGPLFQALDMRFPCRM